ncbi:MAG: hypothetical protein PGN13_00700 [Patulibacter minatonensis]
MNEVLPLLLLPAVLGWSFSEWRQRRTRAALRDAITSTRAPMLMDAGAASVLTVVRSLEIAAGGAGRSCPWWVIGRARTAWDIRQLVAPLGLRLTEVIAVRRDRWGRSCGFDGASRFEGTRHGRAVSVELAEATSGIAISGGGPFPSFVVEGAADGRLVASGAVPPALVAAFETLVPSRHWPGVAIDAAASGITLRRASAPAASWLHDLWLVEFVADLAVPPTVASPSPSATVLAPDAGAPVPGAAGLATA